MIEVRPAPPEHYEWIKKRAGVAISPEFRALEALDGEQIVGMVGYDAWRPNSCSMHVAIEKPIAIRRLLRPAFGLVFDPRPKGLGLGLVKGHVLSTNEKALKLALGLGFRELERVKDGWAVGVDEIMLVMRREDCRWLGG